MQTGWNENRALLCGTVAGEPVLSHENHGVSYDVFPLSVPRLSGAEDRLNVVAARPLLTDCPLAPGDRVEVQGEVRSFNNRTGPGSRLVITLFARSLSVNRRYGRADYLPCIAWGTLAQRCGGLHVGDGVKLEGRLQSRSYQKVVDGVTQDRTAFEVSVMHLEPL